MTLQLEVGKKYLNRRGEGVEIVKDWGDECLYRWTDTDYTDTGEYWAGETSARDLVSEYVEPSTESAATNNKIPHKHADLIIAWAHGDTIQFLDNGHWYDVSTPDWNHKTVYRIKPEKIVQTVPVWISNETAQIHVAKPNLILTFEDGKLIKAEVL